MGRLGLRGWSVAAGIGVGVPEAVGSPLPGHGPETRPVPGRAQTGVQRGESGGPPQGRIPKGGEEKEEDQKARIDHT